MSGQHFDGGRLVDDPPLAPRPGFNLVTYGSHDPDDIVHHLNTCEKPVPDCWVCSNHFEMETF